MSPTSGNAQQPPRSASPGDQIDVRVPDRGGTGRLRHRCRARRDGRVLCPVESSEDHASQGAVSAAVAGRAGVGSSDSTGADNS